MSIYLLGRYLLWIHISIFEDCFHGLHQLRLPIQSDQILRDGHQVQPYSPKVFPDPVEIWVWPVSPDHCSRVQVRKISRRTGQRHHFEHLDYGFDCKSSQNWKFLFFLWYRIKRLDLPKVNPEGQNMGKVLNLPISTMITSSAIFSSSIHVNAYHQFRWNIFFSRTVTSIWRHFRLPCKAVLFRWQPSLF